MSWQGYIDNLLAPDDKGRLPVQEAAICGFAPGQESVWASTPGMNNISAEEIRKLAGKRDTFGQCGPCVGGMKCRMLRDNMEDEKMYSLDLKSAADAEGNTYSVCVGKSKQALVIARGTKDATGGQLAPKVFSIVEHLRKAGY
ncbi:profilin-1-like [Lates japonicus]